MRKEISLKQTRNFVNEERYQKGETRIERSDPSLTESQDLGPMVDTRSLANGLTDLGKSRLSYNG